MDRLAAMRALVTAVDEGSLTAAGRRLDVPLPTVSRWIAELEAGLGTSLLLRSTRRLSLTASGAAYVAACRRILDEVAEAERAAAGEQVAPRGELVVAAPIVFGRLHLLPLVGEFLALYPDIDVRLRLSDRNADLVEEGIDVALRIGALSDSTAVATQLGSVRRVICGSPALFAAHGIPRSPEDLAAMPCVTFDLLASAASWTFDSGRRRRPVSVAVRSRLSVNTAEAARDAAIAGVGVTRTLSYQVQDAVEAGALVVVLAEHEPPPLPVQLLHPRGGALPQKLRRFLDFAAPRLRSRLRQRSAD
jgi:DNA-binding transcriptional LysR family regulator